MEIWHGEYHVGSLMRAPGVVKDGALPVHKGTCKGTVGVRITQTQRWYAQTGRPAIHTS